MPIVMGGGGGGGGEKFDRISPPHSVINIEDYERWDSPKTWTWTPRVINRFLDKISLAEHDLGAN